MAESVGGDTSFSGKPIWRFPEIGVPVNHQFLWDFPWILSIHEWGTPIYGKIPVLGPRKTL
jgi:hypothetical protein